MADHPLDGEQATRVLLAVLLNNPNLKKGGKTPTGNDAGLCHLIWGVFVLDEFEAVDRTNVNDGIVWLQQRPEQACKDVALAFLENQANAGVEKVDQLSSKIAEHKQTNAE